MKPARRKRKRGGAAAEPVKRQKVAEHGRMYQPGQVWGIFTKLWRVGSDLAMQSVLDLCTSVMERVDEVEVCKGKIKVGKQVATQEQTTSAGTAAVDEEEDTDASSDEDILEDGDTAMAGDGDNHRDVAPVRADWDHSIAPPAPLRGDAIQEMSPVLSKVIENFLGAVTIRANKELEAAARIPFMDMFDDGDAGIDMDAFDDDWAYGDVAGFDDIGHDSCSLAGIDVAFLAVDDSAVLESNQTIHLAPPVDIDGAGEGAGGGGGGGAVDDGAFAYPQFGPDMEAKLGAWEEDPDDVAADVVVDIEPTTQHVHELSITRLLEKYIDLNVSREVHAPLPQPFIVPTVPSAFSDIADAYPLPLGAGHFATACSDQLLAHRLLIHQPLAACLVRALLARDGTYLHVLNHMCVTTHRVLTLLYLLSYIRTRKSDEMSAPEARIHLAVATLRRNKSFLAEFVQLAKNAYHGLAVHDGARLAKLEAADAPYAQQLTLNVANLLMSSIVRAWFFALRCTQEADAPPPTKWRDASRELKMFEGYRFGGWVMQELALKYSEQLLVKTATLTSTDKADVKAIIAGLVAHTKLKCEMGPQEIASTYGPFVAWLDRGRLNYCDEPVAKLVSRVFDALHAELAKQAGRENPSEVQGVIEAILRTDLISKSWFEILARPKVADGPDDAAGVMITAQHPTPAARSKAMITFVSKLIHARYKDILADINSPTKESSSSLRDPLKK